MKYFSKIVFSLVALLATLFVSSVALAQVVQQPMIPLQGGLTDQQLGLGYGAATGLSATDPRITAARIVRNALGLLGIITVMIIIYAGFLWFTAAGNDEKVSQAKGYISTAVVGLVIILTAYGIAALVVNNLVEATGYGTIPQPFLQNSP